MFKFTTRVLMGSPSPNFHALMTFVPCCHSISGITDRSTDHYNSPD